MVAQTTDSVTIEAQTNRPMLLLITDAYSKYWKADGAAGKRSNAVPNPARRLRPARHSVERGNASPAIGLRAAGLFHRALDFAAFRRRFRASNFYFVEAGKANDCAVVPLAKALNLENAEQTKVTATKARILPRGLQFECPENWQK